MKPPAPTPLHTHLIWIDYRCTEYGFSISLLSDSILNKTSEFILFFKFINTTKQRHAGQHRSLGR